jgi:hypothetical protein
MVQDSLHTFRVDWLINEAIEPQIRSPHVTIRNDAGPAGIKARASGAALCVGVAAIHVIDQGGIPGSKTPEYVGVGYWVLEVVALLTATALVANRPRLPWYLALGVAAGPLVGYALSRGPGLPDYSDDRGNWTEPLGLLSLAVEAVLLVLSAALIVRTLRNQPATRTV